MKILNLEQGTKEWQDARMAKVTGTKSEAVMGTSQARTTLVAELIAEEATEMSKAHVSSAEMERGTAEEIFAIRAFEKQTGKKVDRIGMCIHETMDWVTLSPDGLIKNSEGKYTEAVEVKCPDSKKAILYKIHNQMPMEETGLMGVKGPLAGAPFLGIPADYKWQVVHYFVVNEDLERLHFVVYDERFIGEEMKLYIVTVERKNEILQEAIAKELESLESFREYWQKCREVVLTTDF